MSMSMSMNANESTFAQKRISPYGLAALLTVSRLFALSMYTPSAGENAALTAVTALAVSLLKLPLFMGAARLCRSGQRRPMVFSVLTGLAAAVFIAVSADAFADMLESVYPDRMTKLAVTAVLMAVCAYTASMGIEGTVRTACIMPAVFAAVCLPVMLGMRGHMLADRIDLYTAEPLREMSRTAGNLLRFMFDPVLFLGLLPFAGDDGKSASRAVKPYLIAEALISCVFFLMHGAVMGRYFGRSGYAFFTLSYCTHGSLIDRANGIFTCVASVSAVLTIAALMTVLRESIKTVGAFDDRDRRILPLTAAAFAVLLTAAAARKAAVGQLAPDVSLVTGGTLLAAAAVTYLRRKERIA